MLLLICKVKYDHYSSEKDYQFFRSIGFFLVDYAILFALFTAVAYTAMVKTKNFIPLVLAICLEVYIGMRILVEVPIWQVQESMSES